MLRHTCVRMSRVLVALALATSALIAVGTAPAVACSCESRPVGDALPHADGAFIGTLVSRGEAQPNDQGLVDTGEDVDFVFEVETWVKGDLEPGAYVVRSPSDGSSCGYELPVGSTAAILVYAHEGQAHGGLCDTHSAASLRAHVEPGPVSTEPGRYITQRPATILDEQGQVVSIRELPPGEGRDGMKACGGPLIAETGHDEVIITDISTWDVVERLQFRRFTRELHCDGDRIIAVAGPSGERRVWDVRTREALTGQLSRGGHADLQGDLLAYSAIADGEHPAGVRVLDLSTGVDTFLHAVEPYSSELTPAALRGVQLSPDGTRVVFSVLSGEGRAEVAEVFVYTLDGDLVAGDLVFDDGGRTFWLSDDELLFRTGKGHALVLRASDLEVLADLGLGYQWLSATDGVLYGMSAQQIQTVERDGSIALLGEISAGGALQRLPEPVRVINPGVATSTPRDLPISSPAIEAVYRDGGTPPRTTSGSSESPSAAAQELTGSDVVRLPGEPADSGSGSATFIVVLVLSAVSAAGVLGLVALTRRRRSTGAG